MPSRLKIHPAIGIARLGRSDEFYLGPTTPGVAANQGGKFRDATPAKALKCQGARFQVFTHDTVSGVSAAVKPGSVLDGKTVAAIEWTVHLANKNHTL